jgi:hypothetical protein
MDSVLISEAESIAFSTYPCAPATTAERTESSSAYEEKNHTGIGEEGKNVSAGIDAGTIRETDIHENDVRLQLFRLSDRVGRRGRFSSYRDRVTMIVREHRPKT